MSILTTVTLKSGKVVQLTEEEVADLFNQLSMRRPPGIYPVLVPVPAPPVWVSPTTSPYVPPWTITC